MAKAVGIGGVFLKARDPEALSPGMPPTLVFPPRRAVRWHLTDSNRPE
jgi:hypothetical protein